MSRGGAEVLLDVAAAVITVVFILGVAVRTLLRHRGRRMPIPWRVLMTFAGVMLAIAVARVAVGPSFANWVSLAFNAGLGAVVLAMRRVLNRLEARLAAYIAETDRLVAEAHALRADNPATLGELFDRLDPALDQEPSGDTHA